MAATEGDHMQLTSGGIVGKFSFPSEGRLDRQRTCFCNVYDFEMTLTVQHLRSASRNRCDG